MRESIIIRNLGPLKDIKIDDIKPFTIFIGESGSGKSLLMKTLIFFRYYYKMLNIRWYLKNSNVRKNLFKLKIDSLLSPELRHYFKNKNTEVIYTLTINDNEHSIVFRNGTIERNSTNRAIPNEDLVFLKESWISEQRNVIPQWIEFGNLSKSRNLDFYFQETYNDFRAATESIDIFRLKYLGLDLKVEKKGGIRKYFIHPEDSSYQPIEWKFGSSGVQTSSSIIALAEYFTRRFDFREAMGRSILSYLHKADALKSYNSKIEPMEMPKMVHIHIEEPELNLFPTAQCGLLEELCHLCFHTYSPLAKIGLMIATHSPYIVNYLNVLINRPINDPSHLKAEDLDVYRIYEGTLQSLIETDASGKKLVNTYDLTEEMERIFLEYEQLTSPSHGR